MEPIRVLIIDDHDIILDALRQTIESPGNRDIQILGTAKTERDALEALKQKHFDVVVVDMYIPPDRGEPGDNEAGIRIVRAIAGQPDAPKILGISGVITKPEFIVRIIRYGADGYILKEGAKLEQVIDAIRRIYRGEKVYPQEIVRFLVDGESGWLKLTDREKQVWELIADGYTNQEIAKRLFIGVDRVKHCTSELYSKLGVANRAQATRKWAEAQYGGLIDIKLRESERG